MLLRLSPALLVLSAALPAQNLVKNGSFEEPPIAKTAANWSLPGWTVRSAAYAEIMRGYGGVPAPHGQQWLELDGSTNYTISQPLATIPGRRYALFFREANRQGSPSSSIAVLVDGAQLGVTSYTGTAWRLTGPFEFVAEFVTTVIEFQAKGPSDGFGDWIDDVVVVEIAESGDRYGYNYYLPQYAIGDAWASTINLVQEHEGLGPEYLVDVYGPDGQTLDASLNQAGSVPAGGAVSITPPAGGALRTGWVHVRSQCPLNVSETFRQRVSGRPDFEAAVLARSPTSRMTAPFDNTAGYVTSIGLLNPNQIATVRLTITLRSASGAVLDTATMDLPPRNQIAFTLPERIPSSVNQQGSIEITSVDAAGGSADFVPLGLRFTPGGAFSTLPY